MQTLGNPVEDEILPFRSPLHRHDDRSENHNVRQPKASMRVLPLLLVFFVQAAMASDARVAADDLKSHIDNLTLVVVGRPVVTLTKVGDSPCFTKLHTGESAFGTLNDAWFGGPPSASDITITREEMLAVIRTLEEGMLERSVRRECRLDDIKRSAPGYPTHRFEGSKEGLTAGAVAIGYTAADSRVVYYLARFDERDKAIHLMTELQEDVKNTQSAAAVIGNIIWRLRQRRAEGADGNRPQAGQSSNKH